MKVFAYFILLNQVALTTFMHIYLDVQLKLKLALYTFFLYIFQYAIIGWLWQCF